MCDTQHKKALDRIYHILDDNSFVETGALILARNTDFIQREDEDISDGVITGHGLIDGNLVFIYSQDSQVLNGTIGEMHAKKIVTLYEQALKVNAPIIGLIDSRGIRLNESFDALNGLGEIFRMQALASGKLLQICGVFGTCGGGMNMIPAMADFVFLEENSRSFIHTPDAVKNNKKELLDFTNPMYQSENIKIADKILTEEEIYENIKKLISIMPGNCKEDYYFYKGEDDLNRSCDCLKANQSTGKEVLKEISDENFFYESKKEYGKDIVTGFIRLNGMTVGSVVNEKNENQNLLSADGCQKAADFIRFCDAFHIPIFTAIQVVGFVSDMDTEHRMAKAGADLVYAYSNATSAKVSLICGDCYTSAAMLMNTKALGADVVLAWPNIKYGILEAKTAVKFIADDKKQYKDMQIQEKEFDEKQNSIIMAAKHGHIDSLIEPKDTRKYLVDAFEMLYTKTEGRNQKRHESHMF